MNSSEKLRFLLIRQFVYFGTTIGVLALMLMRSQVAFMLGLLLGVALIRFVMPRWERKLREADVRLTSHQRHIYFGVGMIYFLAVFGALLAWAIRHSSPPAWAGAGLGFTVLFVALYAAVDLTYGRNSKV
jgi:uncharacterized membrane protein